MHHIVGGSLPFASLAPDISKAPTAITIHPEPKPDGGEFFGKDGLTFGDILDVINPLQHIPIISTIYQKLTGDTVSPAANIIGGVLFGGPIGLAAAVANEVVSQVTGNTIGGNIVDALTGGGDTAKTDTQLAALDITTDRTSLVQSDALADDASFMPAPLPQAAATTKTLESATAKYQSAQAAILSIFEPEYNPLASAKKVDEQH